MIRLDNNIQSYYMKCTSDNDIFKLFSSSFNCKLTDQNLCNFIFIRFWFFFQFYNCIRSHVIPYNILAVPSEPSEMKAVPWVWIRWIDKRKIYSFKRNMRRKRYEKKKFTVASSRNTNNGQLFKWIVLANDSCYISKRNCFKFTRLIGWKTSTSEIIIIPKTKIRLLFSSFKWSSGSTLN